jgi:butyryl-CoA dehydrogenase
VDVRLSAEQKKARDEVREFCEKEIAPFSEEWDRRHEFPWEAVRKMAARGYLGAFIPKEHGGLGVDYITYTILCEEISRACGSCGVIMSVNNSLSGYPLMKYGTHEQKTKFLMPIARGERLGCFAQTEPGSGSDAGSQTSVAKRKGDEYIISGTKRFITNGANAGTIILFASVDLAKKHRGLTAFVVDSRSKGFSVGKLEDKMGLWASDCAELVFDECAVPAENLLGKEGDGFKVAMDTLDGGRIGIGAQSIGIAQRAFDAALAHAKSKVIDDVPVGANQHAQFALADMAMGLEASRLLVRKAAWLRQHGVRVSKEAAIAKLFSSEFCMRTVTQAVQVMGLDGTVKGSIAERCFRDSKVLELYEGTSEIQRLVIAGQIYKELGVEVKKGEA